jgi:seryl-tRNA synthetase
MMRRCLDFQARSFIHPTFKGLPMVNPDQLKLELDCAQHALKVLERQRNEAQARVVQVEVELEMTRRTTTARITELDKIVQTLTERSRQLDDQLRTAQFRAQELEAQAVSQTGGAPAITEITEVEDVEPK